MDFSSNLLWYSYPILQGFNYNYFKQMGAQG